MTKKYLKRLMSYTPEFQQKFIETISKISVGDFSGLDVVLLQGKKNAYRCRVGKFRILFHQDASGEYIIDDIGSRGDIYK